jgi:sulfite exporter TauE/SafE
MNTIDPSLFHTASFLAIFIASLLGSLHCVGMCGGLALVAGAQGALVGQLWYHTGRGLGYLLLGAAAGGIGGAFVYEIGRLLQPGATLTVATYLLVLLLVLLTTLLIVLKRRAKDIVELSVQEKRVSLRRRISSVPLLLGVSTAGLPCPWLYSFVMLAATTGSAAFGMKVMVAFWLGTVPALLVAGTVFESGLRAVLKKFPSLAAVAFIFALGFALIAHLGHDHSAHQHHNEAHPVGGDSSSVEGHTHSSHLHHHHP